MVLVGEQQVDADSEGKNLLKNDEWEARTEEDIIDESITYPSTKMFGRIQEDQRESGPQSSSQRDQSQD